ncbi:MAG: PDZ domain-containing protein [Candidatus Omnitrophica bacterium]|nr:PDZ domain-containing protein [Candidatus Omnitrophota bacterium]
MAKKTVAIERGGPDGVNKALFGVLVLMAVIVVVFIHKMDFHLKPADPRLWLGVETLELTPATKRQFDIRSANGLLVARTFEGSPAGQAGIKDGDVIRLWNGVSVTGQEQFQHLIQTTELKEKVTVSVDRGGKTVLVFAKVGIRPGGV